MENIYVDFDGTVVDPSERLYRLYSEELGRLGCPALPKSEYWARKRLRQPERAIVELTCPTELVDSYLTTRLKRIEDDDLLTYDVVLPGAREALRQLALSCRLVLVSQRSRESALLDQVEALGLASCFASIKASYAAGLAGWRAKAAAVSTDPRFAAGEGLTVGDTEDDVLMGHSLGIGSVAVLSGIRSQTFLCSLRPTAILDSVAQLPVWLAETPSPSERPDRSRVAAERGPDRRASHTRRNRWTSPS